MTREGASAHKHAHQGAQGLTGAQAAARSPLTLEKATQAVSGALADLQGQCVGYSATGCGTSAYGGESAVIRRGSGRLLVARVGHSRFVKYHRTLAHCDAGGGSCLQHSMNGGPCPLGLGSLGSTWRLACMRVSRRSQPWIGTGSRLP